MVSLHRTTLCVYLLLSPHVVESIFFRSILCRLFRRGCRTQAKPPTLAPVVPVARAPRSPANTPLVPKPPVTKAPVATRAPVPKFPINNSPFTNAPVTKASVTKPPTRAPVKPPTRAPVQPPTRAPVASLSSSEYFFSYNEDEKVHDLTFDNDSFTVCIGLINRDLSNVLADHTAVFGSGAVDITVSTFYGLCVTTLMKYLVDGPNKIQITGKDATRKAFTVSDDIWMGSLSNTISYGSFDTDSQYSKAVVTIADDPEVKTTILGIGSDDDRISDYVAMPINRLMFAAGYNQFNGYSWVVPVFLSSFSSNVPDLPLYPPSEVTFDTNGDLSYGSTVGWNSLPVNAEVSIVRHVEFLPPKRSLRNLQFVDNNINICTSKTNPTVRLLRGVLPVDTGATAADIRFRFSTNDVNNRHGYHVRTLVVWFLNLGFWQARIH
jgi:hypothetical protein